MEHILSLSAIRAQKATLSRVILDAQTQLAELDIAERIVRRFGQETPDIRPDDQAMEDLLRRAKVEEPAPPIHEPVVERALTSKALFLLVLRQSPDPWMTANEIQERATTIKGQDVPMATVSPTLSNMKNDGLIVREGLKVALASRINEIGNALMQEFQELPSGNGAATAKPDDRDEGAATPSHPPFASNPTHEEG